MSGSGVPAPCAYVFVAERDAEAELHLPALGPHIVEDEAEQLLATAEVQAVQTGKGSFGETRDPLLQVVRLGELCPPSDQSVALYVKVPTTGVEVGGPPRHLGVSITPAW